MTRRYLHFLCPVLFALFLSACSQTTSPVVSSTASEPSRSETNQQQTSEVALVSEPSSDPISSLLESQTQPTNSASDAINTAALNPENTLRVLPFDGIPAKAGNRLNQTMQQAARAQGLSFQNTGTDFGEYQLKGYFSAFNDGNGTLLVYVWDVLDRSGNSVHRINGQERNPGSRTDPWQAITEADLKRLATRTSAELKGWMDKQRG